MSAVSYLSVLPSLLLRLLSSFCQLQDSDLWTAAGLLSSVYSVAMVTSCSTSGEGNKTEGGGNEAGLVLLQGFHAPVNYQSKTSEVRGHCWLVTPPPQTQETAVTTVTAVRQMMSRINMWSDTRLDQFGWSFIKNLIILWHVLMFVVLSPWQPHWDWQIKSRKTRPAGVRVQRASSFLPVGMNLILDLISAGDTSDTFYWNPAGAEEEGAVGKTDTASLW